MGKPDHGMYGIKIILPAHLEVEHFVRDYDGRDGRCTLMNFADDDRGRAIAANIPMSHRSLVYVTQPVGGFVWAIEYTGTLADGERAARAFGLNGDEYARWNTVRPIRILSRVARGQAVSPMEIERKTGIEFVPNSFTHKYITKDEYERMSAAIPWA